MKCDIFGQLAIAYLGHLYLITKCMLTIRTTSFRDMTIDMKKEREE